MYMKNVHVVLVLLVALHLHIRDISVLMQVHV